MTLALSLLKCMMLGSMLVLISLSPISAHECPMTLNELPACITHHWEMGDISNQGIYNSLLAKANAAISAHDRGQTNAAINVLDALINEVSNLSSKQITADAAAHIIEHAQNAI